MLFHIEFRKCDKYVVLYKEFAIRRIFPMLPITCYMMEMHHGVVYRCYVIEINQTGFGLVLFD